MAPAVNLNADMGEGFGAYDIGNDEALLSIVTSANVACGFHAGDATVMQGLVMRARKHGVSLGAHPGFNDLWGFGRRRIDMKPSDLEYMIAYQVGALQGIAHYAGIKVTHVKPHGALYNMASENEDYATAIGRGIKTVDSNLIYVLLSGSVMEKAAEKVGLKYAREGFVDRTYEDDGNLTSRKIAGSVIHDPKVAAERVVRMIVDGEITARSGKKIKRRIDSLCIHGDEPTAAAVGKAARDALVAAGVRVLPLPEMPLG
jgi:UPF0271 protein